MLLGVTVADCTPILLYDPKAKLIAAVHAGWRGTEQMIALAAVRKMMELGASPLKIFLHLSAHRHRWRNMKLGLKLRHSSKRST